MALKLKGSTSGFVAIDAPSVAGNNTLILPENTGSAQQLLGNDITAGVVTFTSVTVNRNGDLTVPGTISIGGTLTYEDVTSVDSVGIVTARSGVRINGGGLTIIGDTTGLNVASGISTFQAVTATTGTFTGDVSIPDTIVHTGDTNTKIRFPAADTFTVETGGSERFRIDSTGNTLIYGAIRKDNVSSSLAISGGNAADSSANIVLHGSGGSPANITQFRTGSTERLRIDAGGRLIIGHTAALTVAGHQGFLQLNGDQYSEATFQIVNNANSANGSYIQLSKQRSGSAGGTTIVQNGDNIGKIRFTAADGTNLDSRAAEIEVEIDGAPGENDTPGRMILSTTADGAQSTTERMRIDSKGRIGIQGAATKSHLEVRASGGATDQLTAIFGADEGQAAGALSDNTDKACRIAVPHYDTDEEPFAFLVGSGTNGTNTLNFGGGTSLMNAATEIKFSTGANSTTTSGTSKFEIQSDGTKVFNNHGGGTIKVGGSSAHTSKIVIADNGGSSNGNCLVEGGDGSDFFTITSAGNIKFASGKGIDFSLTSDGSGSMSSELFDDYEEGTWTPSLTFGGNSTGIGYGSRSGSYIKIGTFCYVQGQLDLSSKGSSTGDAAFDSLPFTAGNYVSGTSQEGSGFISWWSNGAQSDFAPTTFWVSESSTSATIYRTNNGTDIQTQTNSQWANNTAVRFFAQYRTT